MQDVFLQNERNVEDEKDEKYLKMVIYCPSRKRCILYRNIWGLEDH
jgi:hypothetical protein